MHPILPGNKLPIKNRQIVSLPALLGLLLWLFAVPLTGMSQSAQTENQINIDPNNPREYRIAGITVTGTEFNNPNVVIMVSELYVGQTVLIPGEQIANAIRSLWRQQLFQNVAISVSSIQGNSVFLNIEVKEMPRLTRFEFEGVSRADADKLREQLNLVRNDVMTEGMLFRAESAIREYFIEEGFLRPAITIEQVPDTARANTMGLIFNIDRGQRTRIANVNVFGNYAMPDRRIKRLMENTRERSLRFFFSSSKLVQEQFEEDKQKVIDQYNEIGKRDARIVRDSIYFVSENRINIDLHIEEGPTYFFRNITWIGNTVFPTELLNGVLGIESGDVYNKALLDKNLLMNPEGTDVSSLYLDNGYLFFDVTVAETSVENDSIDLELRVFEGKQASINRVMVSGNDRTNDHVIMREIRTRPGELFSRSDIIRSQRDILALGFFDQEKINVIPRPNPVDGTVDIEYVVTEISSDQIELSGGWGAGRIIGTIGVTFNNFSTRNLFNREAWRPLPTGDGQKLSIRAQSFGRGYISYNLSFMEPWLGGRRPNALSVSLFQTTHRSDLPRTHPNFGFFSIFGGSLGLSQRLQWPDDFFMLQQSVNYQNYHIENSPIAFAIQTGQSNNLNYNIVLGRNSTDAPLYPRSGSEISLSLQITPPYSLFTRRDFAALPLEERFRWIEYHKWRFNTSWFTTLAGNLVLSTRTRFGFLGYFNPDIGLPPFERFFLGGDGISGWEIDGREIISLRGYANFSLTPTDRAGREIGAGVFNKYTMEVRYPIVLSPMSTIYALAFVEGGNAWSSMREFNPFDIKRSAGFGLRIFLPMFGLLGIDYGYGFDQIPGRPDDSGGRFHFSIGRAID
ncbi:MAG TPA: outer membrane protein assembly factor BamA [Bacteroidales bacterium]|nr:outer membrane protein assembly factor BamA [Bacteroidales bacterium]